MLTRRRLWQQWQQQCPHAGGSKSGKWTVQREQARGVGGRSDKAVAMLPCGGQAADDMTRGGRVEKVGQGKQEADNTTRGGGGDNAR